MPQPEPAPTLERQWTEALTAWLQGITAALTLRQPQPQPFTATEVAQQYNATAEALWRQRQPAIQVGQNVYGLWWVGQGGELRGEPLPAGPDEKASVKARELLRSKLNDIQRRHFDRWGYFYVTAKSGKDYKIEASGVAVSDGKHRERLCIAPQGHYELPVFDTMLALKLAIEADEDEFLKTANHFPQ